MRRAVYIVSIALVLCALLAVTASGKTTVTRVSISDELWYLQSESPVTEFANLIWEPDGTGSKKDPQIDFVPQLLTSETQMIQRDISWRLDDGQLENIDWKKVQHLLWADFKVRIGQTMDISVTAMSPVECYAVCGCVYASYSREVYHINHNGFTAVISVLRPVDGMAVVFNTCCRLQYPGCDGCPEPINTLGTCAASTDLPFNGICTANSSGSKRRFRDEPSLTHGNPVLSTWGEIKALYGDD